MGIYRLNLVASSEDEVVFTSVKLINHRLSPWFCRCKPSIVGTSWKILFLLLIMSVLGKNIIFPKVLYRTSKFPDVGCNVMWSDIPIPMSSLYCFFSSYTYSVSSLILMIEITEKPFPLLVCCTCLISQQGNNVHVLQTV